MDALTIKHQCTTSEAIRLVKKAPIGARFNLSARIDAPIVNDPGMMFPNALRVSICVSKPSALRIVTDALSETMEKRGGRIPITEYRYDNRIRFFIGH